MESRQLEDHELFNWIVLDSKQASSIKLQYNRGNDLTQTQLSCSSRLTG